MSLINKLSKAWSVAEKAHRGQLYGEEIPYLYHLGQVFIEANGCVLAGEEVNAELLLLSAILHDTLEDTVITEHYLADHFGPQLTFSVRALTKDDSLAREMQMADSLARIRQQPCETALVKLCDRIANLSRQPPLHWDGDRIKHYAAEGRLILAELGHASPYLADRLEQRIEHYLATYAN